MTQPETDAPEVDAETQAVLDEENELLTKAFNDAQEAIRLQHLQSRVVVLAKENARLKRELEELRGEE